MTENDQIVVGAEPAPVSETEAPAQELTADSMPLMQVLEAILFSTDLPLSAGKLAEIVGHDSTKGVKSTIRRTQQILRSTPGRLPHRRTRRRLPLLTLPQYAQYIERLVRKKDDGRLTPASLETLAIVAYKQPLTRASIEAIRGVACGEMLRALMEHNLVKIVGRAEEIGRPMLYGTTRYFLEVFGLGNIRDLPKPTPSKSPSNGRPAGDSIQFAR